MAYQELKAVTNKNIGRFTFKGKRTNAKVIHIHDGDTCDLVFEHNGELMRFKYRLAGVDTPELGIKDILGRDARIARDYLAHLSTGEDPNDFDDESGSLKKSELQEHLDKNKKLVYATFGDFDKYGRPHVTLKSPKSMKKSFSGWLDEERYVKVE